MTRKTETIICYSCNKKTNKIAICEYCNKKFCKDCLSTTYNLYNIEHCKDCHDKFIK